MTSQASDTVMYMDDTYQLIRYKGSKLLNPQDFGIFPLMLVIYWKPLIDRMKRIIKAHSLDMDRE